MRISTTQVFTQGIKAFGVQQTKLAQLQEQISTGTRINKPSDDPAASARILEMEQALELNEQYQVNIGQAESRLNLEETALNNVTNILQRIRELALQANNASQSLISRNAISFEIDEVHEELLSLSNTIDANGDYLFAGHQSKTQPFTQNTTGSISHIDFNGDQGQRFINISQSRQMNIDTQGRDLFMSLSSTIALNESTTSVTATMAPAHVFDSSSYVAGEYRIEFTGPNTFNVVDVLGVVGPVGANIVTGASYTDGQDIDFQGIRTSITGAPVAGNTFTISQGQYQDMFSIVSNLSETLKGGLSGSQINANIAQSLQDIDTSFNKVLEARTSIGGRQNALEAQYEDNEALITVTQTTLGKIRDTDLAEAISQLTLEQTTLEAAQAVFTRITRSSLFNFLR